MLRYLSKRKQRIEQRYNIMITLTSYTSEGKLKTAHRKKGGTKSELIAWLHERGPAILATPHAANRSNTKFVLEYRVRRQSLKAAIGQRWIIELTYENNSIEELRAYQQANIEQVERYIDSLPDFHD